MPEERLFKELQAINERLTELHQYVVGKPGQPGLVGRHDLHEARTSQLEQNLERRRKLEWGALGTLFALIIERLWSLVK